MKPTTFKELLLLSEDYLNQSIEDPHSEEETREFFNEQMSSYGIDAKALYDCLMESGANARQAQELTIKIWGQLSVEHEFDRVRVFDNPSKKGFKVLDVIKASEEIIPDDVPVDVNTLMQCLSDLIWEDKKEEFQKQYRTKEYE